MKETYTCAAEKFPLVRFWSIDMETTLIISSKPGDFWGENTEHNNFCVRKIKLLETKNVRSAIAKTKPNDVVFPTFPVLQRQELRQFFSASGHRTEV